MEALESKDGAVRLVKESPAEFRVRAKAAGAVAATHAPAVDAGLRFPSEAFDEIRAQRLLGIMVPTELGGEGATLGETADVCYELGQACASTGLIFAMHQVKVGCVVRHSHGRAPIEGILRRVVDEQLLLASSTTEGKKGGNVRSSEAAVEHDDGRIRLERQATVISYAMAADGLVTTARRSDDAAASDQVLLVLLKQDYTLDRLQGWDTMGMRGTCSEGFTLRVDADAGQILPDPYEKIHIQTMVPFAHLLWGSVWAGIAAAATSRAQAFLRKASRGGSGQLPPGAAKYTDALTTLRALRGVLASSLDTYERIMHNEKALASLDFQSTITLTKVQVSELAVSTVLSALRACGLTGYRNDSEFSVTRHLRDVLSSPLMINNERILENLAAPSLMTPIPATIRND